MGISSILDDQAGPALDFVACVGAQRLAHEVGVGDAHDRVGGLLGAAIVQRGAEALHEQRHPGLVDAPHRVHGERDLQVVAAEDRLVPGELLGIGVRRDADVRDVEQPGAAGRRRPPLDAVEAALAKDRAFRQVADIACRRVGIARAEQPDERGGADADERRASAERRTGEKDTGCANGRKAVAGHDVGHGRPPLADGVS